jgi:hypothetical protein
MRTNRYHTAGHLLLMAGGVVIFITLFLDTSVGSVHNLGLLTNRICLTVIGAALGVIGAIFLTAPADRG